MDLLTFFSWSADAICRETAFLSGTAIRALRRKVLTGESDRDSEGSGRKAPGVSPGNWRSEWDQPRKGDAADRQRRRRDCTASSGTEGWE